MFHGLAVAVLWHRMRRAMVGENKKVADDLLNHQPPYYILVGSCNDNTVFSRLATYHVGARSLFEHEWNTTDCSLCVLLYLGFCLFCTIPMAEEETAILNLLLEFFVVLTLVDVRITEVFCLLEDVVLYVIEEIFT